MPQSTLIRSGTRAICIASLVVAGGGCGGGDRGGPLKPSMLTDDKVRASEAAARAAAEAEGAAVPAEQSATK